MVDGLLSGFLGCLWFKKTKENQVMTDQSYNHNLHLCSLTLKTKVFKASSWCDVVFEENRTKGDVVGF